MRKRRPVRWKLVIAGIVLAIVVFSLLVSLSLSVNWPAWTGFVDYTTPKSDALDYHPGRTLWDWLGLLVVPAVLVLGGYLFSRAERNSNETNTRCRIDEDRRIAKERVLEDRKIAEEQRSEDRRIEAERIAEEHRLQDDRIRDALLREYLDRMSDLLITHKLSASNEGDPQRLVARARTVTLLDALGKDGARKGNVVRFLYEAHLLNKSRPVVSLQDADLSYANLYRAKLNEVNLSGAFLNDALLPDAVLTGANLSGARMFDTILAGANLSKANLKEAKLCTASGSMQAILDGARLAGANLEFAGVTREQLESAADLEGAILPDHIQLTGIEP